MYIKDSIMIFAYKLEGEEVSWLEFLARKLGFHMIEMSLFPIRRGIQQKMLLVRSI